MSNDLTYILECIKQINPASLTYEEWLNIGIAIKNKGGSISDWDNWSRSDTRYREHDCEKKWNTFKRDGIDVGTVVKICRDNGGTPPAVETESRELDWNSTIRIDSINELKVVRSEWLDEKDLPPEPDNWSGINDFVKYIETLFEPDEYIGVVTESYALEPDKNGEIKYVPTKGMFNQTRKEIIAGIKKYNELGYVIGDHKPEVGAWIRFNPLDGKGVHDDNVTDFRYTLVESDEVSVNKQYSIYKELELPIAALVTSGKKSLHAIVRIDADNMQEYRNRVDYLYKVCESNGLKLDNQNRNPSRLSRLPGVDRNGRHQRLVETNIGQSSWAAWKDWIEEQNDDLPDFVNLGTKIGNMPKLADELISGVLRRGHKMLIAGPSKAGKSFLLMELAYAIASGTKWLGCKCRQGDVLYVNLELDEASAFNRMGMIYESMEIKLEDTSRVELWNLRGKGVALDKLAPKLIRRASKKKFSAVIIDPIYKVLTGDENSAEQMAKFCNQFDTICEQINTSVIYCHHHSKGDQGHKRSADRSSGSGVFSRDPDAVLDLIELNMSDDLRKQINNQWLCEEITNILDADKSIKNWREYVSQDDLVVSEKLIESVQVNIKPDILNNAIDTVKSQSTLTTAWRLESTLREFPALKPVHCYFRYPVHELDEIEILKDCLAAGEEESKDKRISRAKKLRNDKINETLTAYEIISQRQEEVTIKDLMEELSIGKTAVYTRLKQTNGALSHKKGIVTKEK